MKGDYKKHGMCLADVSVMVMLTYLLSDSTTLKFRFLKTSIPSTVHVYDIQITEFTLSHRFSITESRPY